MFNNMVAEILEKVPFKDGKPVFSEETRKLIHEAAGYGKESPFFKNKKTKAEAEKYAKGLAAEEVYLDMLGKIANAPTMIHARASAMGLLVVVDEKLQEEFRYPKTV